MDRGQGWQGGGWTRGSTRLSPREELPYSRAGLLVERSSAYVKINVRLMLTFMWNGEDSALVRVPHALPPGAPPGAGRVGLAETGAVPHLPPAGAGPQVCQPDLRPVRRLQWAPGRQ